MSKQSDDKSQAPIIADSTRNSELNGALGDEVIKRVRIASDEFERTTGKKPVSVYLGYAEWTDLKNCCWTTQQYVNTRDFLEPKIDGKRLFVVTQDSHLAVA